LRGFGAGIMFLPLNTRALINLKGRDLIEGSAIFNLLRQLGGSLGIAILATLFTRGATRHMAEISGKATLTDQETQIRLARLTGKLISLGCDPATGHLKALGFLEQALRRQAALLSFQNLFAWVGWVMIFSLPLVFLFPQSSSVPQSSEL
jgi:DHA2 family multidrug resistance protein